MDRKKGKLQITTLQFLPICDCNFKCKSCIFSISKKKRVGVPSEIKMDFNLYKKCIDEVSLFPNKLETLRFAGVGEPLLYDKLSDMIKYAKKKDVAKSVELVTNGSLLNFDLSDKLISIGLDRLEIIILGTSYEKYKEIGNVELNMDYFFKEINYFCKNKKNTYVNIKLIGDKTNEEESNLFLKKYNNVGDSMEIDYTDYYKINKHQISSIQINPDGNVFFGNTISCYLPTYSRILGNCYNKTLQELINL